MRLSFINALNVLFRKEGVFVVKSVIVHVLPDQKTVLKKSLTVEIQANAASYL